MIFHYAFCILLAWPSRESVLNDLIATSPLRRDESINTQLLGILSLGNVERSRVTTNLNPSEQGVFAVYCAFNLQVTNLKLLSSVLLLLPVYLITTVVFSCVIVQLTLRKNCQYFRGQLKVLFSEAMGHYWEYLRDLSFLWRNQPYFFSIYSYTC